MVPTAAQAKMAARFNLANRVRRFSPWRPQNGGGFARHNARRRTPPADGTHQQAHGNERRRDDADRVQGRRQHQMKGRAAQPDNDVAEPGKPDRKNDIVPHTIHRRIPPR